MPNLLVSYTLGIQAKLSVGVTPSATSEQLISLLEQNQNNTIQNSDTFKYAFSLTPNQSKIISFSDIGLKFLKLLYLKSDNIASLSLNTKITEGSLIFIDNLIPSVIPTTISTDTLTITNNNTVSISISLVLLALI